MRLLSEDQQVLELVASYHPQPSIDQLQQQMAVAAPHHVSEGLTGQVARTGVPILIPHFDPHQYQAILRPERWSFVEHIQPHSAMVVPLRVRGRVIGTLTLLRNQTPEPYTPEDQQFVQELADRAAFAVENTRLFIANQQELTERKQAEETLRRSEATQRALINAMPDLMFRFSREGVFLAFETAHADDLARPPSEFVGKHVSEVMPPGIAQQTLAQIELVFRTGEIQVFEYQYPLASGLVGEYEARLVLCDPIKFWQLCVTSPSASAWNEHCVSRKHGNRRFCTAQLIAPI